MKEPSRLERWLVEHGLYTADTLAVECGIRPETVRSYAVYGGIRLRRLGYESAGKVGHSTLFRMVGSDCTAEAVIEGSGLMNAVEAAKAAGINSQTLGVLSKHGGLKSVGLELVGTIGKTRFFRLRGES